MQADIGGHEIYLDLVRAKGLLGPEGLKVCTGSHRIIDIP